jgi:aminoglycoside 3'-phosphotransferase-2
MVGARMLRGTVGLKKYDAPLSWTDMLGDYHWNPAGGGASEANVFILRASGAPDLFAKSGDIASISSEIDRLIWLRENSVRCPDIMAFEEWNGKLWMLMSALRGKDLASNVTIRPERAISIATEAICLLHSLDVVACSFDSRLDLTLSEAYERVAKGLVDVSDFDAPQKGRTPESILQELHRTRPNEDNIVVGHGDISLGNILVFDGMLSGVIDCGRVGLADAHRDLAIATREITARWGPAWSNRFLEGFPHTVDPQKIEYYRLLDELF